MNYQGIDRDLVDFAENPYKHISYLEDQLSPISLKNKILFKIKPLRYFISSTESKNLLYGRIVELLKQGINEKQLDSDIDEITDPQEQWENVRSIIGEYFCLFTPYLEVYKRDKAELNPIDLYLQRFLSNKIGYHCDRICESLDLVVEKSMNIISDRNLWLAYYLSELCFLIERGLLFVKIYFNNIYIYPTAEFGRVLKRYWFSETMENTSIEAEKQFFNTLFSELDFGVLIYSKELMDSAVDLIIDKVFSIRKDYLSSEYKESENYELLRSVVAISILIETSSLRKVPYLDFRLIEQCPYISEKACHLFRTSVSLEIEKKAIGELIHKTELGYVRGYLDYKYGLKKLVDKVLQNPLRPKSEQNWGEKLGVEFEEKYLLKYINDVKYKHYKALPGIKSKGKEKIKGYDVDLIIYDTERMHYYFVQVKYVTHELPKYFTEQYTFYNDKKIQKGITQLKTFKDNVFTDNTIQQKLASRGVKKLQPQNCTYIFLHNIPYLNLHEEDGIFFYEWNTFRGILNGGEIINISKDSVFKNRVETNAKFDSPESIIEEYLHNEETGAAFRNNMNTFFSLTSHFELGEFSISSKAL